MATWKVKMFTALFWKKVWTWLKHYWYWPVIIVLLIFGVVAGRSTRTKMFELLEKQKQGYEKEIQILEAASKEKEEKKNKVFEDHREEIDKIEKEHDIKVSELQEKKKEELASTIQNNKGNPESLAREVAKVLSAQFHKNNR
jgi:uncharacterized protein YdiU (UPF0061 family)